MGTSPKRPFLYLLLLLCTYIALFDTIQEWKWRLIACVAISGLHLAMALRFKINSSLLFIAATHVFILVLMGTHYRFHHVKQTDAYFFGTDTIHFVFTKKIETQYGNYWVGKIPTRSNYEYVKIQTTDNAKIYFGDRLDLIVRYIPIPKSSSWESFRKDRHYSRKHIGCEAKLIQVLKITPMGKNKSIRRIAQYNQQWIGHKLQEKISDTLARSLAKGLLLGIVASMDGQIIQAFRYTGTAHVLAVSGLHVSMLYLIITRLLTPLGRKGRWPSVIVSMLSLCAIWYFCFITGLEAAIMRACGMFSIYELGRLSFKRNDGQNNLYACASLLLAFNPCSLFDIGFQLSFMAMLSIIIFQPMLYNVWRSPYRVLNYMLDLAKTTLAVQVLITPLGMYYFHQFPVSFLLANLLWVPLSFAIMCLAIVIVVLPAFGTQWIDLALKLCCDAGMFGFKTIQQLPFYYLSELRIHWVQLLLLYLSFLFFYWYYTSNRLVGFRLCTASIVAFMAVFPIENSILENQNEAIIYNIPRQYAIDIKMGRTCYRYSHDCKSRRAMEDYIRSRPIDNLLWHSINDIEGRVFKAQSGGICISFKARDKHDSETKNLLILSSLLREIDPACVLEPSKIDLIFIPAHFYDKSDQWKNVAKRCNIQVHDAKIEGHLKIQL